MIEVMGLSDRYNNTDVFYTVFALGDDTADALLKDLGYENLDDLNDNDKLALSVILTYHFLPGAYTEATFDAIQKTADAPIPLASAPTGTTLIYDSGKIDDTALSRRIFPAATDTSMCSFVNVWHKTRTTSTTYR